MSFSPIQPQNAFYILARRGGDNDFEKRRSKLCDKKQKIKLFLLLFCALLSNTAAFISISLAQRITVSQILCKECKFGQDRHKPKFLVIYTTIWNDMFTNALSSNSLKTNESEIVFCF